MPPPSDGSRTRGRCATPRSPAPPPPRLLQIRTRTSATHLVISWKSSSTREHVDGTPDTNRPIGLSVDFGAFLEPSKTAIDKSALATPGQTKQTGGDQEATGGPLAIPFSSPEKQNR